MEHLKFSLPEFAFDISRKENPGSTPVRNNLLQQISARWKSFRQSRYFVRCPCPTCGGMVSIRECMVQGKHHWFCTEASRDEYESKF